MVKSASAAARGANQLRNIRMARIFNPRQSHAARRQLICANSFRRLETFGASIGDDVVLINTVAADTDGPDQHAVFEKRHAARENLNAVGQIRDWRAARHWIAAQDVDERPFDQRELESVVEWAPDVDRF